MAVARAIFPSTQRVVFNFCSVLVMHVKFIRKKNRSFFYKFTIIFSDEVEAAAKGMIGDYLITKQTGAEGRICNSVMVTERKYTRKEYYLAFMNDRKFNVSSG